MFKKLRRDRKIQKNLHRTSQHEKYMSEMKSILYGLNHRLDIMKESSELGDTATETFQKAT